MSDGNVYTLTDEQIYVVSDANVALNIYCYKQISGSGGAKELSDSWQATILPLIVAFQSVAVGHQTVTVINLDNDADFNVQFPASEVGTGTQTGDCLPRYNAFKFFYVRSTRASRNGWKRIMGIPESVQVNGVVTNGGEITALEACAAAMATGLVDGSGNGWLPKILRRAQPDHTPPIDRADFAIDDVVWDGITTQNSRKR